MTINFQSIGAGEALMEGTFTTTSDTTGTFSMRRVASRTELQDGEHRIAFVDLNDENALGGTPGLEGDGCILTGSLAGTAVVAESSKIVPSPRPEDAGLGV